MYVRF